MKCAHSKRQASQIERTLVTNACRIILLVQEDTPVLKYIMRGLVNSSHEGISTVFAKTRLEFPLLFFLSCSSELSNFVQRTELTVLIPNVVCVQLGISP